MKVAEISAFNTFSVGKIMNDIKTELQTNGIECKIYYARGKKSTNIKVGNSLNIYLNALIARLFDNDGFCESSITKKIIHELDQYKPDVIHLHCLHGYYFNSKVFFKYLLKHPEIKVIWTMHDNWAITGHCAYFDLRQCNKWKNQCMNCPSKRDYPKSLFDHSSKNHVKKIKIFSQLPKEQMVIVSPSKWLDNIIGQSFLNKYEHKVIYNGIDANKFNNMNLNREKILLAVASVWDERKNLNKVLEIGYQLKEWRIVIVGVVKNLKIPNLTNIKFIDRTENSDKLVELYNKASILINPTIADNFPTVNIEAQLCGLKVLCYASGGSLETNIGGLIKIDENTNINDEFLNEVSNISFSNSEKDFSRTSMGKNYCKLFIRGE